MAFVPALIAGLGGLGGLFGNRSQTQRTTQNTQFNNQGNQQTGYAGAASSNPLLNPAAQSLLNPIANNYLNLIGQDQDLSGYKAGAIGDINQTSNIHKQALEANLAQRGITGPAAASALNQNENSRFSDITKLNQQLPLLQLQLMLQKLQGAGGFFSQIPTGTYNEQYGSGFGNTQNQGTQNMQGTGTQPGNQLGGLFGGLGTTLAGLYGMGSFGGPGNNNGPNRLPTQRI